MSNIANTMIDTKVNDKKIYIYDNIDYYKVSGLNNKYFIKLEDYYKVTLRQQPLDLFTFHISGLKKVKAYIKSIDTSDILFIASPSISSRFIMYDIEKIA